MHIEARGDNLRRISLTLTQGFSHTFRRHVNKCSVTSQYFTTTMILSINPRHLASAHCRRARRSTEVRLEDFNKGFYYTVRSLLSVLTSGVFENVQELTTAITSNLSNGLRVDVQAVIGDLFNILNRVLLYTHKLTVNRQPLYTSYRHRGLKCGLRPQLTETTHSGFLVTAYPSDTTRELNVH